MNSDLVRYLGQKNVYECGGLLSTKGVLAMMGYSRHPQRTPQLD